MAEEMLDDKKGGRARKAKEPKAPKEGASASPIARLRQWLLDSYNGLFKIVIQPQLPKGRLTRFMLLSFVLGLIWAYAVAPTHFYDGAPSQMSSTQRDQYVKLIAGSYASNMYDEATVTFLLRQIEDPSETVTRLANVETGAAQQYLLAIQPMAAQADPGTSAPSSGSIIGSIFTFIIAVVVFFVLANIFALLWGLLIGGFVDRFIARLRPETEEDRKAKITIAEIKRRKELEVQMRSEAPGEGAAGTLGAPIMQRVSTYTKGRAFDDSFAIEDANDMFLGECGATIAKTIGETQELAAVEIWLFDKEDFVRTLTKLFVSEHAYNDPVSRSELEPKVENPDTDLIIVKPGAVVILETDQIRVQAKIADVKYGSGPLPPNSYFKSLTLRMEAWEKSGAPAAAPVAPGGMAVPPPMPAYSPPPVPAPMPSYAPPPSAPSPMPSYSPTPPPPAPMPQPASPQFGTMRPLTPPPIQYPPPPAGIPGDEDDDDPFGGTGDFTPIGS